MINVLKAQQKMIAELPSLVAYSSVRMLSSHIGDVVVWLLGVGELGWKWTVIFICFANILGSFC